MPNSADMPNNLDRPNDPDRPELAVAAIYLSAVKSLALEPRESVSLGPDGIAEDRRFHLIDGRGRLLTQRQLGRLALVSAAYDPAGEWLRLAFPDGRAAAGVVELGERVATTIWGRRTPGAVVVGPWGTALSEFCGGPVRLVQTETPGAAFDEYPVSLLSQASVEYLTGLTRGQVEFHARRFRPNFLIEGGAPHQEDGWLGGVVRLGPAAQVRLTAPDPRCAITAVNPDTGQRDFNTPGLLQAYRPTAGAPCFGIYGAVAAPGIVSVGDRVWPP